MAPKTPPASLAPIDKIGRVPNASVLKHTKRGWAEWVAILDKAGARDWTHKEIVAFLHKRHKVSFWWQQEVTIGYEIHVGRRLEGQNQKGEYSTTATKTFPIDAKAAWKLMFSLEGLDVWLKPTGLFALKPGEVYETESGAYGQVRTLLAPKRARLSWQESHWRKASFLQVYVIPRAHGKCMVVISHDAIATGEIRLQLKERWRKALDELAEVAQRLAPAAPTRPKQRPKGPKALSKRRKHSAKQH
jgi:hypothetical protein